MEHSPYMYILLEWLSYQHVAVELACVTIGACLSRDTVQQDSVCGHLLIVIQCPACQEINDATLLQDFQHSLLALSPSKFILSNFIPV